MRSVLLFYFIFHIIVACSQNNSDTIKWEISLEENALEIPVGADVMIDRMRLNFIDNEIVYNNNLDLHFYNYKTGTVRIDTSLRAIRYVYPHGLEIYGSYPSGLILVDHRRISFYDILTQGFKHFDLRNNEFFGTTKIPYKLPGSAFGLANRYCSKFLPVTDIRSYTPENANTSFYFLQFPEFAIEQFDNFIPEDFLDRLYNLNPNFLSPIFARDVSGNGINIGFKFTCDVYNLKKDGTYATYRIEDPDCSCELDDQKFIRAKSENSPFPRTLPKYGNLYPNFYDNYYYQFIQSEENELGELSTFLRVIDENYQVVARMEFPFDDYRAQLLFLPDGTYVQSNQGSFMESEIKFHKINLVKK